MPGRIITDSEAEILKTLAREGEHTYTRLLNKVRERKTIRSNRTVLNSLKRLKYLQLIDTQLGPNERGTRGRKATYCNLTLEGLLTALLLDKECWEQVKKNTTLIIDEIANHQAGLLPLIFGKWMFYSENKLKDDILESLQAALMDQGGYLTKIIELRRDYMDFLIKNYGSEMIFMSEKKRKRWTRLFSKEIRNGLFQLKELKKALPQDKKMIEEHDWRSLRDSNVDELFKAQDVIEEAYHKSVLNSFQNTVFFGSSRLIIDPKKKAEFLSISCKDTELKKYISNQLNEMEKGYETYLNNIRSWKSLIERV